MVQISPALGIKRMKFLRRILFGCESWQLQHPVLGKLMVTSTKPGAYWEGELTVEGESIGLAIEPMNGERPTKQQVEFYQKITGDLEATFGLVAPLLAREYEKWLRAEFPVERLSSNASELSNECVSDRTGRLFTCYFERGIPTLVSIDG